MTHTIHHGDNLSILQEMADASVDMIYIDPPFNTQKTQVGGRGVAVADTAGSTGFAGRSYRIEKSNTMSYSDSFGAGYIDWLKPRMVEMRRVLKDHGTLYLHIDWRESHRVRLMMEDVFGEPALLNEIVWAYDYGGRPKDRWPSKHDTIFMYAKNPGKHWFDREAIERIPYMAPGLVTPEKAARGKLPTDVWWHTIVPTNGSERTGYPTQKPVGVVRRAIQASCPPGGIVLDAFAGSGTTGAAAVLEGKGFILIDANPEAIEVMRKRFSGLDGLVFT